MSSINDELTRNTVAAAQESNGKLAYSAPRVTKCGSVLHLTQGQNGTKMDVGQNNNTRKGGV